jgi:cation:H+ antiporter
MVWLQFIFCAALIVLAGYQLSQYGDVIAEKSGWGRTWVGVVLIASVTSLPELITGVSAIILVGQPDLAVGGIFGSCLFNILLIAVLDLVYQPGHVLQQAHEGHTLSASLGIVLIGIASMRVFVGSAWNEWALGWIGPTSLIIFFAYLLGERLIFRFEQRRVVEALAERAQTLNYAHLSTQRAVLIFTLAAIAIVGLGVWLSFIGDEIARTTGLGTSFVGNVFLAIATSLPEVVVTLSAVRLHAIDLAIGNLFGSNLFNVAILAIYDLFYLPGPLWGHVTPVHLVAGLGTIAMTAVAIVSITYRASPKTPFRLSWDAILLMAMYGASLAMLYLLS